MSERDESRWCINAEGAHVVIDEDGRHIVIDEVSTEIPCEVNLDASLWYTIG